MAQWDVSLCARRLYQSLLDELEPLAAGTGAGACTEDYLQAGAEIIETNTLARMRFGSSDTACGTKVGEINQAGVSIARQAVRQLADKQGGYRVRGGSRWALGVHLEPLARTRP